MAQIYDFYYTFVIDDIPFSDLADEIVDYFKENDYQGLCYKKDDRMRVITIGMTRREVEEMKYKFKGYHVKQLVDLDVINDCLNPFLRFYGIRKEEY